MMVVIQIIIVVAVGKFSMGDRISIQFKNGRDKSVVLFSHWDGLTMLNMVKDYFKELKREFVYNAIDEKSNVREPLDRLEPETIMVDFIRWFTKGMDRVTSNYYLGKTENDGDNSDNGHHIIDVNKEFQDA